MKNMTTAEKEVFEMRAKNDWNKDPQIRADFNGSFERYLNYLQKNDNVKFKILGGR